MTNIRLYIVCDDPAAGAWRVMQCLPGSLPAWVRVLTQPLDIIKMPDGARCIGTFTRRNDHVSAAELAWRERRERGGISPGLTAAEIDGLSVIIENRKTQNRVAIGHLVLEDLDIVDRTPPAELPAPPAPAKPTVTLSTRWT